MGAPAVFASKVIATGCRNATPDGSRRYAEPRPRGAVFVISRMDSCVGDASAPAGTWTVSLPSAVASVPPAGPMGAVIGGATAVPAGRGCGLPEGVLPEPQAPAKMGTSSASERAASWRSAGCAAGGRFTRGG
jgi:hypothetical protein